LNRLSLAGVIRAAVFFGALLSFTFIVHAPWIATIAIYTLMYAGLSTAWNLLGGFSGYVSLGHVAFFGVGAYAIALKFQHGGIGAGYTPFYVLPLVGLGAALISVPIAWVAFRTRGSTFAIITLTLLFVVQSLAFNLNSITHGAQGVPVAVPPFPAATYERPFYLVMLALFAFAMLVCWFVRGSKLGLMLFAIRDDEDRARGVGVQNTAAKLITFAISVGITAMIGGVWAYYSYYIYPQFAVDPLITIGIVLMAYLGGRGTLWGPALGAFILVPAQKYLASTPTANHYYLIAYSAVFMVVILLMPRGIIPSLRQVADRLSGRTSRTAA
jgi:branched-chain amino acid transport system permease protein